MPQPSYIGSGAVPQTGDTRLFLLAKRLGAIQNGLASPNSGNNPKPNDTVWMLRRKIVKAKAGL